MTTNVLTTEELISGLAEATKISLAAQVARLLTAAYDEEGNEIPQEEMQAELNDWFAEIMGEFDATLKQVLMRMAQAKEYDGQEEPSDS